MLTKFATNVHLGKKWALQLILKLVFSYFNKLALNILIKFGFGVFYDLVYDPLPKGFTLHVFVYTNILKLNFFEQLYP